MYSETIPVEIGYCLTDAEGGFAFQPPRSVFSERDKPLGTRAIQNCPAVNSLERHLIEMPSPIGIRLRMDATPQGPNLKIEQMGTFVQEDKIREMLIVEPPQRWRHPRKPVIQIRLPFFFVTDEPAWVSQIPPFLGSSMRRWPGLMVAGRYPVTLWPQNLTWGFEWDKPGEELVLKQGEPLCYFLFEFGNPNKRPKLVEAALTPELDEWRRGMEGLHHLTPDIEGIWESAKDRRPAKLMTLQETVDAG
ncbi:MAG: hypothetical protein AAGC79_11365 [Pseudomonadota bacterium]